MKKGVKHTLVRGAAAMLTVIPYAVGQLAVRLWLRRVAALEPGRAVRALLEIDGDLANVLDHAAARYDNGVHVKHRLMRYHDFFVERIRPGEQVLDVGCGMGALAHDLATRAGAVVTGIDTNGEYLEFARRRFSHPQVTYIETDAVTFQPGAPFDVVVLSNVLEHIEQRVEFLRRLLLHVRPQRLLIRVPRFDRDWRVPFRKELGLFYFSDSTHFTEYTAESFVEEMHAAALAIAHTETCWGEIWAEVRPATSEGHR